MSKTWTSHKQNEHFRSILWKSNDEEISHEQVVNKSWTSYEQFKTSESEAGHEFAMNRQQTIDVKTAYSWTSHEQTMQNTWSSHEQVIKKWSASCEQVETSKKWTSHQRVVNTTWASHEQVMTITQITHELHLNKLWASH